MTKNTGPAEQIDSAICWCEVPTVPTAQRAPSHSTRAREVAAFSVMAVDPRPASA